MADFSFSYGIPTKQDYYTLLSTNLFLSMQKYSNVFLQKSDAELSYYKKKWVADPLHQWSRQYEYPFVFSEINKANTKNSFSILDAGSGITFFPFYLKQSFSNVDIHCCDYDEKLSAIYRDVSKKMDLNITFKSADIRRLPYANATFDIIYCISVLEHTDNFDLVLEEFQRILKPNGKLILTFDIALDNFSDIPAEIAEKLLSSIRQRFNTYTKPINLTNPQIITTNSFKNTSLLPWKYGLKQVIKNIVQRKSPLLRHHLTFYCLTGEKQ